MPAPRLFRPSWRRELHEVAAVTPLFRQGGISFQREPIWLGRASHASFEVHWLEAGTLVIDLAGGRRLSARGGDLMLTAPGTVHRGANDIIPPSRLLWLHVDPSARDAVAGSALGIGDLAEVAGVLRAAGDTVRPAASLRPHFRRLHALLRKDGHAAEIRAELSLFLLAVCRVLRATSARRPGPLVQECLAWMAEHPTAGCRVSSLARRSGWSPSRFHAVFLAETGETPASCHRRLRIARACELLRADPGRPIAEVAAAVGYGDQRAFATAFRRCTGMTASRWRSLEIAPDGAAIDAPVVHPHP